MFLKGLAVHGYAQVVPAFRAQIKQALEPRRRIDASRPSREGLVIAEFPDGVAIVEKVRTADENWVMVRVQSDEGDLVEGFVQPSELLVIN